MEKDLEKFKFFAKELDPTDNICSSEFMNFRFSKGAFVHGQKLQIVLYHYKEPYFPLYGDVFICCTMFHRFNAIHAGVYDPSYLGITDYSKDWEIVANDVIFLILG